MSSDDGRRRLGLQVRAERMKRYRTVDKARIEADISRGAWEHVESGKPVKEFTLGAVEQALGWDAGRAQRIIDGADLGDVEAAILASDMAPETKEAALRIMARDREAQDPGAGVRSDERRVAPSIGRPGGPTGLGEATTHQGA